MASNDSVYRLFAQQRIEAVRFTLGNGDDRDHWQTIIDESKKYTLAAHDTICLQDYIDVSIDPIEDLFESFLALGVFDEEQPNSPSAHLQFDTDNQSRTICHPQLESFASHYTTEDAVPLKKDWPFPYPWHTPVLVQEAWVPKRTPTEHPEEFIVFMNLPAEIRRLIYLASVEPQVVWLWSTHAHTVRHLLRAINSYKTPTRDPNRLRQWSDLPLLRVCHESRDVMLEIFGRPLHRVWHDREVEDAEDIVNHMPMSIPFNPMLDSVRIAFNYLTAYELAHFDHASSRIFETQRLHIDFSIGRYSGHVGWMMSKAEEVLEMFRHVRHLAVTFNTFDDCFHCGELGHEYHNSELGDTYDEEHLTFMDLVKSLRTGSRDAPFSNLETFWIMKSYGGFHDCSGEEDSFGFVRLRQDEVAGWTGAEWTSAMPLSGELRAWRDPVLYVEEKQWCPTPGYKWGVRM